MPFTSRQIEVLTKYKILKPDGSRATCKLVSEKGPGPLGDGPLVEDEVIETLLGADTTENGEWLDWIFFQAGGGAPAEEKRLTALEEIKKMYYAERLEGFEHPVTHAWVPPRPKDEVDVRWARAEPTFLNMLFVLDQDSVIKTQGGFGFYRAMPGRDRIYQKVAGAVTHYLALAHRAAGSDVGAATPEGMETWQELDAHSKAVIRHYAAQDVRHAGVEKHNNLVYSDEVLDIMVPLTFPTSVKYGYPKWSFSSPDVYKEVRAGRKQYFDWKATVETNRFYAFITFHVPVPGWMRGREEFWFTNLALELPRDLSTGMAAVASPDEWMVWDEENQFTRTIADVKKAILDEPARPLPPPNTEPITLGAKMVKTPEEAQHIVQHLDAGLAALVEWAKDFDFQQMSPDLSRMPD